MIRKRWRRFSIVTRDVRAGRESAGLRVGRDERVLRGRARCPSRHLHGAGVGVSLLAGNLGYLRLATNPRVFKAPLTPSVAVANIETLLALPNIRLGAEEDDFLSQFERTTTGMVVRGDLVPDAHLVALMAQYGVDTVCSHDRDFGKFKGTKIYDPFVP